MSTLMSKDEPLPKKPRLEIEERQSLTKEELALQAIEESALKGVILANCSRSLELCKQLSDKLYRSLLDGAAILAYLLFDKEELYEIGESRMLYDQQNKFWEELERFAQKGDSFYEVCKWIANSDINWDEYSLLNESNVASMLIFYNCNPYRKPFADYTGYVPEVVEDYTDHVPEVVESPYDDEVVESPYDDDIEEAIKKAKQYPRLTVDEYTFLLLELLREDMSLKCQEYLLAKAVEFIDVKTLYSLEADAIQDLGVQGMHFSVHEQLDMLIKHHLMALIRYKKYTVRDSLGRAPVVFSYMYSNEFEMTEIEALRPKLPQPVTVFEFIELAELRRKAVGSRFINRDHFVWAFHEIGCGHILKDELASRMGAEDRPPYYIYDIMLRLARAEYVFPNVYHLAFAVSAKEVKELQEDFKHFKTGKCDVIKPKELSWEDGYFGDYSIKVFKEHVEANNGIWWNPFK